MKYSIIALFLIYIGVFNSSEKTYTNDLQYEVNRIYLPLSISKTKLDKANTLTELSRYYKSSWVKEFISVEVSTIHKGAIKKAVSKNDVLSEEQKNIMKQADIGTDIEVKVSYIPDNTLKNKEIKKIDFSFRVNPENEAKYIGGQEKLNQYLKKNAIDKIPNDVFKNYALAAVKFTIDEKGQIVNPHIFESSKDEKIDKLLLKTISDMPDWKAAEYANGTKIEQEFALTVGNHESCVINLLNIGKLSNGERIND